MDEVISHPWFDVLNNKEGGSTAQPFLVPPLVQQ
jgi:hypothetical protein